MAKLRELGEDAAADAIERATPPPKTMRAASFWPFTDRAWQHTAHSIGFCRPAEPGLRKFSASTRLEPPVAEKRPHQHRLNVLRVADYPGGGEHRVLFDFYARNQVPGASEDLHFNAAYRAREGDMRRFAAPIFVGLGVGATGVAFQFHTVNVANADDEAFLDFLEGDIFKSGLKLATTMQPAIALLAGMALALTKSIAKPNRNVSVQDCFLGLDFAGTAMGRGSRRATTSPSRSPKTCNASGTGTTGSTTHAPA